MLFDLFYLLESLRTLDADNWKQQQSERREAQDWKNWGHFPNSPPLDEELDLRGRHFTVHRTCSKLQIDGFDQSIKNLPTVSLTNCTRA